MDNGAVIHSSWYDNFKSVVSSEHGTSASDYFTFAGQPLTCKAAVCWQPGKPLEICNVIVAPPKKEEVRVRVFATGVCHTDLYTRSGSDPEGKFPCILGHEGSGIVESVGEGVSDFSPGDHVVLLYIPQCKKCEFCLNPKTNLCQAIRATQGQGYMPDGTSRFTCDDKVIYHYMGTSTFSEYTVVSEYSLCKINDKASLDLTSLLGCGVSTGYGAAINTAKVNPGSTCAVWGLGAVGLAVGMGCKSMKASKIIGVDVNEEKFELAKKFGFTDFVNPMKEPNSGKPEEQIRAMTLNNDGVDFSFECIGNVATMKQAFDAVNPYWGVSVVIGVAPAGAKIQGNPIDFIKGRTWKGSAFGGWKSKDSVPLLVEKFMINEMVELEAFMTHKLRLEQIETAFALMTAGKSIRSVVID